MATAKRRLSPADFDVARGGANDVKAFRKFVDQEGAAALALLEDALDRGAATMHKTAWQCLAQLEPGRAETKALAMTAGLTKKAKAALLPLWVVATTACLNRLVELGVEVYPDKFPETSAPFTRAQGWALATLLRSPEVATQNNCSGCGSVPTTTHRRGSSSCGVLVTRRLRAPHGRVAGDASPRGTRAARSADPAHGAWG